MKNDKLLERKGKKSYMSILIPLLIAANFIQISVWYSQI
jgi:hypothetical protein